MTSPGSSTRPGAWPSSRTDPLAERSGTLMPSCLQEYVQGAEYNAWKVECGVVSPWGAGQGRGEPERLLNPTGPFHSLGSGGDLPDSFQPSFHLPPLSREQRSVPGSLRCGYSLGLLLPQLLGFCN